MTDGRRKGNKFENAVCLAFSIWLFGKRYHVKSKVPELPFRRRFTASDSLEGFWSGTGDILTRSDVKGWPFATECKKEEGWMLEHLLTGNKSRLIAHWEQACDQSDSSEGVLRPLLVFSKNNHVPMVMLLWKDAKCLQLKVSRDVAKLRVAGNTVAITTLERLTRCSPASLRSLSKASTAVATAK